jgi:hypothetical protein
MGLNLSVNILTSTFLVTVLAFFLITGILFFYAYVKVGQILEQGNSRTNDLETLNSALGNLKVAYITAFIAAAATLILAILYAGHETVFSPSEYFHMVIYLIAYVLLIVSVIYAFLALNKINTVGVTFKNGADGYIWAGLLMSIFAFIGLTTTAGGRLGMNIIRSDTKNRVLTAEHKVNQFLPAIHHRLEANLPDIHQKVTETHMHTRRLVSGCYDPCNNVLPNNVVETEMIETGPSTCYGNEYQCETY